MPGAAERRAETAGIGAAGSLTVRNSRVLRPATKPLPRVLVGIQRGEARRGDPGRRAVEEDVRQLVVRGDAPC